MLQLTLIEHQNNLLTTIRENLLLRERDEFVSTSYLNILQNLSSRGKGRSLFLVRGETRVILQCLSAPSSKVWLFKSHATSPGELPRVVSVAPPFALSPQVP